MFCHAANFRACPPYERVSNVPNLFRNGAERAHDSDVPVLLSAMTRRPDWLLTHNTKHFTKAVAQRTSLHIATPAEFFRALATLFR